MKLFQSLGRKMKSIFTKDRPIFSKDRPIFTKNSSGFPKKKSFFARNNFSENIKKTSAGNGQVSRFHSIRFRLIAAFLIMIIPISALGFISQKLSSDALENEAIESSAQTMAQTGKYLDLVFQMAQDLFLQVLSNSDIQEYVKLDRDTSSAVDFYQGKEKAGQVLSNIVRSNKFIKRASVIKPDYDFIGSTLMKFDENADNIKESSWYKKAVEDDGVVSFVGKHEELDAFMTSEHDKEYAISGVATLSSFSTNVENPLFIMDIDASSIQSLIDEIHIGDGAETHLISSDGRVITCLKEGETAQNVSDIAGQAFYQNILQSEEMQGSETVSYKGADHIMVYQKVGDSGYTLIGLIPRAELLKTVTVIRYFTVGLVLLAALVALGMGLYMATGMGRTINRIVDVADGAASGDLTLNPTSHRKDELGFLTGSIAKMISNMRELIQQVLEISQKVAGSADTVATTSQQISATSNEIASAIQEIAHGASEQAGDAEQGSSKMEELAGKINNVSDNAKNIHSVSQDTTKLVKDGLLSIEDLDKKCHQTTTITEAILSDIQQLQQQSRSIDKITKVIDGIVGQTKLLALNAAIEAARAGEAGRGFAVVADEVRKLAEQSMEATREITAIIKATHQQTAQTVERAQSAEETIKSQNQSVVATISIFKQISSSMGSLVASVEHIMSGIAEMEENKNEAVLMMQSVSSVSQQTAASSEEITASAEEQQSSIEELAAFAQELSDAAQQLTESITRFKI